HGYKAALTGEGSDEWMAGYPWYKVHKLLGFFDVIPKLKLSMTLRRLFLRLTNEPHFPQREMDRTIDAVGGLNAWLDIYGLMSLSRQRFFSKETWEAIDG